LHRALGKRTHLLKNVLWVISFDLICGVAADEMKDGESTAWVRGEPLLRDAD